MTKERIIEAVSESGNASTKGTTKIIKRYSNRKLYDTERSKYVTLDEIARMIKAGEEVTIIDNESKEDLTSVTLTQIIFEEEKRESRMPLAMLRNLIQTGGETLQEFFDKSVKAPVVEIKDTATKSVEELRQAATRSVTEWTRVFVRQDDQPKAEEFRKGYNTALDELAKRLDARIREVSAVETSEAKDAPADTAAAAPSAEGQARAEVAGSVREDIQLLRERLRSISALVDDLERTGK